jgi:hypothetical protein
MKNKLFFRLLVCMVLAAGLVFTGCDTGMNEDDNQTGSGNEAGGGNETGGNDEAGGGNETGGNDEAGGGNETAGSDETGGGGETGDGNETGSETTTAPSAPAGVTATAVTLTGIRVSWDAVQGADSYKVYTSEGVDGPFYIWDEGITATSAIHDNNISEADKTWYYQVTAVNSAGESDKSSVVSAIKVGPSSIISIAYYEGEGGGPRRKFRAALLAVP